MLRCGGVFMEIKDSNEDFIFFKNYPILKDCWNQTWQWTFLWKINIIGTLTMCAKSSSMGSNPNCFWCPWAYDLAMCVEPKLRLLVVVRCTSCYNSFYMLVSTGFVGALF